MDGMASHIPVNHQLRSFWRTVAAACGLYVLIFGIVALTRTGGLGFFAQDGLPVVLGLRSNRAFAILSVVVGALFVVGAVVGRNIGRWINLLDFLGFEMSTVVVSFLFGLLMFTAGLYGRVGPPNQRHREEQFRHGGPDPEKHPWQFKGGPKPSHQTEDHRFA